MENRLAVEADKRRLELARTTVGVARIETPEIVMQSAKGPAFQIAARRLVQPIPQRFGKFRRPQFAQLDSCFGNRAERVIHAVDTRARHDAKDVHNSATKYHGVARFNS